MTPLYSCLPNFKVPEADREIYCSKGRPTDWGLALYFECLELQLPAILCVVLRLLDYETALQNLCQRLAEKLIWELAGKLSEEWVAGESVVADGGEACG